MYIDKDSKFFDTVTKVVELIVAGYSIEGFVLSSLLVGLVWLIAFDGFNREMGIKQILKNKLFRVVGVALMLLIASLFAYKNLFVEAPHKSVLETQPFPAEK